VTFEEIKVGQRFRISGELTELIRHPKTEVEGKVINAEYVTGPWKNEFLEVMWETKVNPIRK